MKYLQQILLISLFSFLGEMLRLLIPLPIPASIYGMALLFAALSLKLIKVESVKGTGDFLTSILPLLFVAPVVNLLDCWDRLKPHWVGILCITVFTTMLCFGIAGRVTQWLILKKEGKRHD